MKTKPTLLGIIVMIVLAVIFVMSVIGNEIVEKQEMLNNYAAELSTYISQAMTDLDQTKIIFEKENSEFLENTRCNQRLLDLKQQQIALMKNLLLAVQQGDFETIQELEKQQIINEHLFNIAALEKDMIVVIGDFKKRAELSGSDNATLNASIKKLEVTYNEILKREENVFAQTQYLRSLHKQKLDILAQCEECFEQVNKKN